MEKKCNICKRDVKETIHTQDTWKVDYYTSVVEGKKETITCVDCNKK